MASERTRIDPDGRYGDQGLTRVEANALEVMDRVPVSEMQRTRDAVEVHVGGEVEIVVIVTAEALELRLPTVEWTKGAYGPVPASRLWKRVKWEDNTAERLVELVEAAMAKRRSEFKPCRFCHREFPPEHRHGSVCHGCAERHMGVVH